MLTTSPSTTTSTTSAASLLPSSSSSTATPTADPQFRQGREEFINRSKDVGSILKAKHDTTVRRKNVNDGMANERLRR